MAEDFSRISGRSYAPKLFRIYRDIRFSKDKAPLNAHLHLMWRQSSGTETSAVFFFGAAPEYLTVGWGVMGFKGKTLTRYRAFIDQHGGELEDAITRSGMALSEWGDAPLKRVPALYSADHPHQALLRRKSLVLSAPLGNAWRQDVGGLVSAVRERFTATMPLTELLAKHLHCA